MSTPPRKFTASQLIPGQVYKVVKAFAEYNGMLHPVGEQWRFVQENFVPYEDGLTLFVERNGQRILIQLQWCEETQEQIIDGFSDYVEEV